MDKIDDYLIKNIFSFLYYENKKDCKCFISKQIHYSLINKYYYNLLPLIKTSKYNFPKINTIKKILNLYNKYHCSCNLQYYEYNLIYNHILSIKKNFFYQKYLFDLPLTIHLSKKKNLISTYNILHKSNKISNLRYCCNGLGIQFILLSDYSHKNNF